MVSDSKFIIFQASEKVNIDQEYLESSIYLVKAPSGNPRKIIDTPGKLGSMSISPNNEQLAFLGAVSKNDPLAQSIFVLNIKNGKSKLVTPDFKESFVSVEWIDDQTVIGMSQRGTKTALSTIFLSENLPEDVYNQNDVLAPSEIISSFTFHRYTKQLVITANDHKHPNEELYVGLYNSKKMKRITFSNTALGKVQFARQETISWKARDGKTIQGVLTYPLVYRNGKRYPLILQIHGGPEGVSLDGWNTRVTYPIQLLAANGYYFVLEPNYRGSAGRGVAFSKLDHDDLGGEEFNDVLKGIDHLIEEGFVDKNQVGTGGWSYGGYFSALGATRNSDRFKASMVGAGLTNMISFMGTTDIPYEMSIVHWNQWWFDNQELHWNRSPLSHINKAKTPTLIIHGMEDLRVHPEQGMELWQALKIKNVETEFVLYPREPHGLLERPHQLDYMEKFPLLGIKNMLNKPIFNILIFTFLIVAAFSQERKAVEISLGGSANDRSLEMSSLTWFKDELVLMPQYIDYDDPAFYVIKKAKINNWLKSESSDPIVPQKIKLELTDFLERQSKATKGSRQFVLAEEIFT